MPQEHQIIYLKKTPPKTAPINIKQATRLNMFYQKSSCFFVCCALVLGSNAAYSEDGFVNKKLETERSENTDKATNIYSYNRDDYAAKGIRLGSFKGSMGLGLDLIYDDNIFASHNNEKSDEITEVTPKISLKSDWGVHEVAANVQAIIGSYSDNSDENYEDYSADISGRLDVKRNSYALATAKYDRKHEDRGAPNAVSSASKPTEYNEVNAAIGYVHSLGVYSFNGFAGIKNLDFDNGSTISGASVNNDIRDRLEASYTLQAGYEIKPGYRAFIRGEYENIKYNETTIQKRDSDGFLLVAGTDIDLGGKVSAELYAGIMSRDYKNSAIFKDISDINYGANILWNINGLTSLQGSLSRSIEETTLSSASAYINTAANIELQHEFRRNIIAKANLGYADHDYEGDGVTLNNEYLTSGAELNYLMNKRIALGIVYDIIDRSSNATNNDYTKNTVKLRVAASL